MLGAIPPLPYTPSWRDVQLKKKLRDALPSYIIVILRILLCSVFFSQYMTV
jgi:hypothetical protein